MTRYFLAVAFCCALLCGQPRQSPNWIVTGSVVDSMTGQPIDGSLVVWEPSFTAYGFRDRPVEGTGPAASAARTTTPASGAFTISVDMTATGVRIFVSHPGYRSQDGKAAATLSLRAASQTAVVRLVPQSSVQGSVTNRSNEPLSAIGVNLTRIEIHDGRRQPRETYGKVTGDDGKFSFDDLAPGAYYVRAAGVGYGPTYYPAAISQDQAQLLRVAAGKTIAADFHLESHVAYKIRGIVTDVPVRKTVAIRLLRGEDPLRACHEISETVLL